MALDAALLDAATSPPDGAVSPNDAQVAAPDEDAGDADGSITLEVDVPPRVTDGDVTVSCTATCDDGKDCARATLFVSACDSDEPDNCHDIEPIVKPGDDGNFYIVSVSRKGAQDVLEQARCTTANGKDMLPVDLLFVIDTTSSMANAIDGVKTSVNAFIDELAAKHVSARIGGIAFGNTAPIMTCVAPDAPYVAFTDSFGADVADDEESFNFWVDNLAHTHCGDVGGSDIPENGLDALGYALGQPFAEGDAAPTTFKWRRDALRVVVVITDAVQHQLGVPGTIGHLSLEDIAAKVKGWGVVHVVGPNYACRNTAAESCACNLTQGVCDADCACDMRCPVSSCPGDTTVGACDSAAAGCDPDCMHYMGSDCDTVINFCDAELSGAEACATDIDCTHARLAGPGILRRCDPVSKAPYADMGDLAAVTHGAFTPLPADGRVDLTKLPLGAALAKTGSCSTTLPSNVAKLRCVYMQNGQAGEVTVRVREAATLAP